MVNSVLTFPPKTKLVPDRDQNAHCLFTACSQTHFHVQSVKLSLHFQHSLSNEHLNQTQSQNEAPVPFCEPVTKWNKLGFNQPFHGDACSVLFALSVLNVHNAIRIWWSLHMFLEKVHFHSKGLALRSGFWESCHSQGTAVASKSARQSADLSARVASDDL
jgi:hypothetical protein